MKKVTRIFIISAVVTLSFTAYAHSDKELPLSTNSKEAVQAYNQALDRLWNARIDQYEQKMNEALKADPQCFMIHATNAIVFSDAKQDVNKEKFISSTKTALAFPETNFTPAEKIIRELLVNIRDNNKDALIPLCEKLITTYPEAVASYELAIDVSKFLVNDTTASLEFTQRCIEKFPDHGPAWNTLGYHYLETGDKVKAKEAFDKYLALNPDEANAHDSMGDYYLQTGDFDESIQHFEKAVAMGMDVSRERAERARALARGEDPDAKEIENE